MQSDGGLKIIDFGIARLASSSMTASGFIVGTPDYMSPEQARGVGIDERSDIFSVGAVLYFVITGRKPFVAPDLPAVLNKVVGEAPPAITAEEAPAGLTEIVIKALAKDPDRRYQSFPDLAQDLTRWRRGYEIETRALADETITAMHGLEALAADERTAADALSVPQDPAFDDWLSAMAADYPELALRGAAALRSGLWHRRDVDGIAGRIRAMTTASQPRVAGLQSAAAQFRTAARQLEAGEAEAALAGFERVQRQVPSAGIRTPVERARRMVAEHRRRDDAVRSLIAQAVDAGMNGRLDAARAFAREATLVHPESVEAQRALREADQALAAAEIEKRRAAELSLGLARRALLFDELDEADRQLELARESGVVHAEIPPLITALAAARQARSDADAATEEIARELAAARVDFRDGRRAGALSRLDALMARHPSSAEAQACTARLRAGHARLTAAERAFVDAGRLASRAEEALRMRDDAAATRLAEEALNLVPSQEMALRVSATARAHLREAEERALRETDARRLLDAAKVLMAQGDYTGAAREARRSVDLEPAGREAPAVIAEACQRQLDAAAAKADADEAASRAAELREAMDMAAAALAAQEFARARALARLCIVLDPDSREPRELLARIAAAAAQAVSGPSEGSGSASIRPQEKATGADETAAIRAADQQRQTDSLADLVARARRLWLSGSSWLRTRWPGAGLTTVPVDVRVVPEGHHEER